MAIDLGAGGGGGGVPIGGLTTLAVASATNGWQDVVTTSSGEVYLKTGVVETDTSLYPDAPTTEQVVSVAATIDLTSISGVTGTSFRDITYDGTYLWVVESSNNNVFKLTSGTSPTLDSTIAIGTSANWNGIAYNSGNNTINILSGVTSGAGTYFVYNATTNAQLDTGTSPVNISFADTDGLAYISSEDLFITTGTLSTVSKAVASEFHFITSDWSAEGASNTIYSFPLNESYVTGLWHDGEKLWASSRYGLSKIWLPEISLTASISHSALPMTLENFNTLGISGGGIVGDGTYFYHVSGTTLTVWNYQSVVGYPAPIHSAQWLDPKVGYGFGSSGGDVGFQHLQGPPLYMRVK